MNNTTALPLTTNATKLLQNVANATTDTESGRSMSPVRSSLQVLLCLMVFFFNILILIVISTSKGKFKVTYLFFGHLAVADLLFGFAFSLRFVLRTLPESKLLVPCIATMGMMATSIGTSASGIFFLALQTYVAIKYSRTLEQAFSIKQAKVMITLSWITFIVIGGTYKVFTDTPEFPFEYPSICFIGNKYTNIYPAFYATLIFAVYWPTLLILAVTIKKLIKRQREIKTVACTTPTTVSKPMDTLQVPSIPSHKAKKSPNKESTNTSSNRNRTLPSLSKERRNNDRESNIKSGDSPEQGHPSSKQGMSSLTLKHKNSLIIVMAIVIIFTVCLCPILIGLFLHDVCSNSCGVTDDTLRTIISFSTVQAFSNCIIYLVRNKPFREQLKKLSRCA